ncbi:hypothetical protein Sme01_38340 [Sphaerisporangium melleum]|uniref:Restriction endonuclease type IV Mrr domain-containing protein n=1 Tax=Sphaerisporangium melleum TaxID=321316 RepID=A0A917R198_9ACTN|nr:hypothetical protein [Sphaerisporangium melleum]GGK82241.1 hypothetical protein GCM10007964_26150 [Sphaerisporangium melleum]GII71358.1 hypothetical protein Sme01_38340 [Sphaerisporangium melleum]
MAIDWELLGQPRFDRIVEALLRRRYSEIADVRAFDGRGGDGGRDVTVTQGTRLRIFQLKYFPGGFSSGMKQRRNQIKRSFKSAMAHRPWEWTLVVPCNLSDPEQKFIDELPGEQSIRISVIGRAELDDLMAMFPDLEGYFQKDHLLEAAKTYNQEKAILTGGAADLVDRVHALGRVVDTSDPDWTLDFSRNGDQVAYALRPKHPQAHVTSPIQIKVQLALSRDDAGLAEQVRRSLGYGTDEKIVLPAKTVQSFEIEGPAWLSEKTSNIALEWSPLRMPETRDVTLELRILDTHGRTLSAHQARVRHGSYGYEGRSIKATFYNVADLLFLFPHDRELPSTLDYSYSVAGSHPSDLFRAMKLIEALHGEATGEIFLNGLSLGLLAFTRHDSPEKVAHLAEVRRWRTLADDLDVVQRHCDVFFPIPDELPGLDRVFLRIARLLVEGKCAIHPTMRVLTGKLAGSDSPELRRVLGGSPQCLALSVPDFTIEIGGNELRLGDITLLHPRVVALNSREALSALDTGSAENLVIRLQPENGEHFRAFLPAKWPDDHKLIAPTPWRLPEFTEPPGSFEDASSGNINQVPPPAQPS